MIKAIIFDFFGVLTTDYTEVLSLATDDPGVKEAIHTANRENDLGELTDNELIERIAAAVDKPKVYIAQQFESRVNLDGRVLELIKRLKKDYKVGLLSNASRTSFDPYWTRELMNEYFDEIVVSAEVGMIKPDPRMFELICSKLAVEPTEAIFIDDIARNVAAAEELGIIGIVFTSVEQMENELAIKLGN